LIGKLPGTIQDRSIVIPMKRKKPGERVTKLRGREGADHFLALRRKASRWTEDNLETVRTARPALPGALNDRAQDNWEPLLAIADLAGGDKAARDAALKLSGDADTEASSPSTRLLADIKVAFETAGTSRMTSAEMVEALTKDATGNWAEFGKTGKPLTQKRLASMLSGFDIKPTGNPRGYGLSAFRDAFDRYLSPKLPPLNPHDPASTMTSKACSQINPQFACSAGEDLNGYKSLESNEKQVREDRSPPLFEIHSPEARCAHCREAYDGTEQLCAVDDKILWLHARCQRPYIEALP
jgi:putative DNA primase/helicase